MAQAVQQLNQDETLRHIPIAGESTKTIPSRTTLLEMQRQMSEEKVDYSQIKIDEFPVEELERAGKYMMQIVGLYINGFSNSDWKENNTVEDVLRKLEVQFSNPRIALTLVKYHDYIRGFFSSQVLSRLEAYKRVADSITTYRQSHLEPRDIPLYTEAREVILPTIMQKFDEVLNRRDSFSSDGFDAKLQPIIPVMEDFVIDPQMSTFRTIVDTIHSNSGQLLKKYFDETYKNPYAITWTNKDNPIYQFLTSLGEPHVKLMELQREVEDEDGSRRTITLVVFAVNLEDVHRITSDPRSAERELLRRSLRNNPGAAIGAVGKKLGKNVRRLQSSLRDSIVSGATFGFDLEP